MMRLTFIRVAAALAVAASGGSLAHEPVGQPRIVDVFPAQSWVSLGAEDAPPGTPDSVEPPAAEPPALSDPIDAAAAAPPMPFEIAGEWRTQGQRIVVLERDGKTFLLCGRRCGVRDAVLPGGEIADGYRLKTLGETGPVVMTRNGSDIELSPPSPTH